MDTDTLVADRIAVGRQLITILAETGFDVAAACWIKTGEDDRWFLYIASEEVNRLGLAAAYQKVYGLFKYTQQEWEFISEVKLIGKDNSITKEILDAQQRFPEMIPERSRKIRLSGINSDEVYIYAPPNVEPVNPRLSIDVAYQRHGGPNNWQTRTKKGAMFRGMRVKGAVAYSTARWEGEKEGDENRATVSVLLEVDPKFDEQSIFMHPDVWKVLKSQARQMADEMFKSRHPDATIEHIDEN